MRVAVFGLGYVGCVSAACLARLGHAVTGVDVHPAKVERINAGHGTIVEDGVDGLVAETVRAGRLRATLDGASAAAAADAILLAVGTPSDAEGGVDLTALDRVCATVGEGLRCAGGEPWVVNRSTVPPGTTAGRVRPILEARSGRRAGDGFHLCFNPEFMREGASLADFGAPPFTVFGVRGEGALDRLARLYEGVAAPVHFVPIEEAELLKYLCNAFHALKVGFANEVGRLARGLGLDGVRLMELFCSDAKLNISPAYLRPGFAFGGSCLPKDLRALLAAARAAGIAAPILEAVLPSNQRQSDFGRELVRRAGGARVGLIGLGFKWGTDDLRESPFVLLARALAADGCAVRAWDPRVELARLTGTNRTFIDREMPELDRLLEPSLAELCRWAETVVVNTWAGPAPELLDAVLPFVDRGGAVVDLAGALRAERARLGKRYYGIAW